MSVVGPVIVWFWADNYYPPTSGLVLEGKALPIFFFGGGGVGTELDFDTANDATVLRTTN
jgi:hypothetical protein